MKQPEDLFLRHPRRQDSILIGVVMLIASLIISSLAACTGMGVSTPTQKPGITVSPTQVLKLAGPDSGLYIASSGDATVYKVDYRTGKVLWKYQFKLKHPSDFGPYALPNIILVQQGYVFIESQDEVVYALIAATGHLAWSYVFGNNVALVRGQDSPPVVDHGMLFIPGTEFIPDKRYPKGLSQDLLYMFEVQSGKLLRTYQSVRAFTTLNQVLYASDWENDRTLRAINLQSGQLLWQVHMVDQIFLTPHVISGKVYVLLKKEPSDMYESALYAFDAATGQQLWHSQAMTAGPINDLAISNTTIFCAETNGSLYAYDVSSGHLRWSKAIHFVGNFLVEGNSVYATFNPGGVNPVEGDPPVSGVMMLDATTGSLIWQKIMTAPNAANPYSDTIISMLVHNGILYITQSKYKKPPLAGTVQQTTTLDSSKKTLWQINLGGYDEVLVP